MVNTSKFTFAHQVQQKAQELQEVADEIVKRTVEAKGEVPDHECLEYNGELLDASMMLKHVTAILVEMSNDLVHPRDGNDNSPSKKQKTENSQETDEEVAKIFSIKGENTPNADEKVTTAPPALSRMPSVVQ
jgi:hypothetical protein